MSKGKYKLAREKLFDMRTLRCSLDNLTDMIHEIDDKLDGYKPMNYDGMPKGNNKPNSFTEKLIDEKIMYEKMHKANEEELFLLKLPLKLLEDTEQRIIELYFIEGEGRTSVCEKLFISPPTFTKRKDNALMILEKLFTDIRK